MWGLPQALRFDNGHPWAHSQSGVPTCLALWLVGLGIELVFGRPRQSTDNAWVEPEMCCNWTELDQHLLKFIHIQRVVYPSCDGQARFDAYSDIHQARVDYRTQHDQHLWQRQHVLDYVAQFRFTRTVEKIGRISHFMREYSG